MLYVAHRLREPQDKLGLPVGIYATFTEEFNEKKPMEALNSRNWRRYNRHKDGVPPPEEFRLPEKLFMVCKGLKRFEADFYTQTPTEWLISRRFLAFLQERHLLDGYYEQSELTIVSPQKKPITDKPYYFLRLLKNDNALIDFASIPKVTSPKKPLTKHTPPTVYYPALHFQAGVQIPPMFFLDDPSYWYSFFCNESVKAEMEEAGFLGFDFYTLEEGVQEQIERDKQFLRS